MIHYLRLKNFKVWQDTGGIKLAPITLFFGSNSSGKSSIGQFLMLLKQTVESPDRKAVFYSGGSHSPIQLGSYLDMVYQRDPQTTIEFEYIWNLAETLVIKDPLSNHVYTSGWLHFKAEVGPDKAKDHSLLVNRFNYRLIDNDPLLSIGMARDSKKKTKYTVEVEGYPLKRKQGRAWNPGAPVRFYGFPDEVVAYHQNADFVQELNLRQEQLFRSIYYLGPLRTRPERLYSWGGTQPESVGYDGENTIAAILSSSNREISIGKHKKNWPLDVIIASKLKDIGLIEDFEVKPISKHRQEYEVKVRTKGSEASVDLPDVGFGVSQVLPVLVQCFYAPPGSIIIMEQPELHLHPSAQAKLADVMIEVIQSREKGTDRNIQLIIETHSEHFLRRLQRRIAEESISQDMVQGYFANPKRTQVNLERLEIDEYGNILNWPEEFFGDDMGDVTAQAKAALVKRMRDGQ